MTGQLPYGAQHIVDSRLAGKRPADMVLVSLVGPLRELNPVVVARPGRAYDWRFTARLEVMLVASSATDRMAVQRIVAAILGHRPEYLGIWFADRQVGMHVAFGSWVLRSGRGMGCYECEHLVGLGAAA